MGSGTTDGLEAILASAARGDEESWRRIVGLYARRIFALAKSRVRSPEVAEEITQSVFATLAAKLPGGEYVERGRFESWLFRVAMNRVRDEVRRTQRHAAPTDPETLGALASRDGENKGEPAPEVQKLRAALAELSPADREIVELRHHGGLSFKQLAELLNEPVGTLLARHHRALKKLHSMLTGSGEDAAKEALS